MDGNVKYASLKEAAEDLVTKANSLDDPIDRFIEESQKVGEDGSSAWGGTAAEKVVPILNKIKEDIVTLQAACDEFSKDATTSLNSYQQADAQNEAKLNDVIG